MHYLKGILFILSIGVFQTSQASGPGVGGNYDIGAKPYYGNNSNSEEAANIDSIRRPINDDNNTANLFTNNIDGTGGLQLNCDVTPEIELSHIPSAPIKKSNNLIRKPGSAIRAMGQYIIISGQVVDRDCLPVSDAVITIWQTDSNGKYIESYKLKDDWDVMDPDYDKNFAYSGSTQTNNLGEYNFITILPTAATNDLAPHINIEIKHEDFKNARTRIYFNKHPHNKSDKSLKLLDDKQKELVVTRGLPIDPSSISKGRQYNYNITLEGVNKFRRY